ncbi:MAG: transcriptional repressor [Candidatus Thiodiazotropha taylori]
MTTNDEEQVRNVAAMILRYLQKHPQASDTAEGITRWWVMRQRYENSVQTVKQALAILVQDGALEGHQLAQGKVVYSLKSKNNSNT